MTVRDSMRGALEPYVGGMVADTCVRATALSLGKTADDLSSDDLPSVINSVRRLLAPVAAPAAIENVIASLNDSLRMSA